MITRASTIFLAAMCLLGCKSAASETPAEGLRAILQLYEARDFDALVRTRYAELSKAENEQQVQSLVERFKKRYGDEKRLDEAIATYKSALQVTPELSEDGTVATFKLAKGFIKLSRMPDGKWGFHL